MAILLSFSPFIVFALLTRTTSPQVALFAGAAVAVGLVVREMIGGKSIKVLEAGTAVLFGALGIYLSLSPAAWSILGVRLAVDAGLLAIVLISIVIRLPFTLQYAREQVSPELAARPIFLAINTTITWAWAGAFAVLVIADVIMLYVPDVPLWVGIALTVGALVAAIRFTKWYPEQMRAKAVANGVDIGA